MSRASDIAYLKIRTKILSGELAPGSQLKEEELAEICKVSRTPIRDALRRLEAEMFVRRTDTQRTYVPDWSPDDIAEVFTLRAMLEGHAASRAATRISEDEIRELRQHNETIRQAISTSGVPDVEKFLKANRSFHDIVIAASGSDRLQNMLLKLVQQPIVHRTALRYDQSELHHSHTEHEQLIAAFSGRDSTWAEAVMTGHIRRAFHAYMELHQIADKAAG